MCFFKIDIEPWLAGATLEDSSYCVKYFVREKHGYVYDYRRHGWGKFLRDGMRFSVAQCGSVIGLYHPVALRDGAVATADRSVRFAVILDIMMLNPHRSIRLYRADGCREYGEAWTPAKQKRQDFGAARIVLQNINCGMADYMSLLFDSKNYGSCDPTHLETMRVWLDHLPVDYSFANLEMVSIHREAPVDSLAIFKVGQLREDIYWRFVDLYNRRKKRMMYTVVDSDGNVCQSRKGFDTSGHLLDQDPEDESEDLVSRLSAHPLFPDKAYASMMML